MGACASMVGAIVLCSCEECHLLLALTGSSYRRLVVWAGRHLLYVHLGAALGAEVLGRYELSHWIADALILKDEDGHSEQYFSVSGYMHSC